MGALQCGQDTRAPEASRKYEIAEDELLESTEKQLVRKGRPTRRIAVSINDLKDQKISERDYFKIQEKINKMVQLDKHKLKPLKLTRRRRVANELKDPYYIPSLNAIYIGEWVYEKRITDNLPSGIGRLYFDDELYEGELKSTLIGNKLTTQQVQQIQHNNVLKDKYLCQKLFQGFASQLGQHENRNIDILGLANLGKSNLGKSNLGKSNLGKSNVGNADDDEDDLTKTLIKAEKSEERSEFIIINVLLEGVGRKISKSALESGTFLRGKLAGKGLIQIKDLQYEYNGEFKDGIKHGKGVQKMKTMTYDGDFIEGKKEGKGILIFRLDPAYQKEKEEEEAKLNMHVTPQINDQIQKSIAGRAKRQQAIKDALKQFPWDAQAQPLQTILEDDHFLVEHHFRKKFTEKYSGEFKQDVFQGRGVYEWFNGKVFNGEWKNGKINGYGQFYWPNGAIYRGYYVNDLKQGKGEMVWCQTKRYRGHWFQGIRHGYGEIITIFQQQDKRSCLLSIQGGLWVKDKLDKVYFMKIVQLGPEFDYNKIQQTKKILMSIKQE